MPIPTREFTIVNIVEEQSDVRSFFLSPVDGQPMNFIPGQFITVRLVMSDNTIQRRSYSISSTPAQTQSIRITVGQHGKFSNALFEKKPGEVITVGGPYGKFVFDEQSLLEPVFIAGGIGITPFFSMIRHLADKKYNKPITLLYSAKNPGHILFKAEFETIAQENPNFKMVVSLTGNEYPDNFQGYRRRIDENMLVAELGSLMGKQYYLCGPPPMVEGLISLLTGLGVLKEHTKVEHW